MQDDSAEAHGIDSTIGHFYSLNASDWDSALPLAEYLMVYPVNEKRSVFKGDYMVARVYMFGCLTFKFNGPFNGQPLVSDIAASRSKTVEISNRLFGST